MLGRIADQHERGQAALLTNQESKMAAAGPGQAQADKAAPGRVGNPNAGVVEQFEVHPRLGQHLCRVYA